MFVDVSGRSRWGKLPKINDLQRSLDDPGVPWIAMLERVKGIEPSYAAWEAAVLPLNYTRVGTGPGLSSNMQPHGSRHPFGPGAITASPVRTVAVRLRLFRGLSPRRLRPILQPNLPSPGMWLVSCCVQQGDGQEDSGCLPATAMSEMPGPTHRRSRIGRRPAGAMQATVASTIPSILDRQPCRTPPLPRTPPQTCA